jgi:hypothetical protein
LIEWAGYVPLQKMSASFTDFGSFCESEIKPLFSSKNFTVDTKKGAFLQKKLKE